MLIIIGLGNPIPRYQGTRHNFGQAAISYFQKIKNFPEFKLKRKFESLISEGNIEKEKIILALPQTFMNESGRAVKKLIENCKLKIENFYSSPLRAKPMATANRGAISSKAGFKSVG